MKTTIKLSMVLLLVISACSPKIHFIGNEFIATNHVDLFFDAKDIEQEYKVMGFLQNEGMT